MSSTDFTIDSLLDDLDDVATANDVDSRFSNSKFVPHPPNGEKSQSQVYWTNPKSRFTVLSDTSSSPSSSKALKDSNYENFHADHVCNRSVGSRDSSLSSGSNMKTKNESITNRYNNYDSPASCKGLRYDDSNYTTSAAGIEKENDNDNSVDYLLNMLSHSPSSVKETTPFKQIPVKSVYSMCSPESSQKESQKSSRTFGSSCSLSNGHVIERRYESKSEKNYRSDSGQATPVRQEATTIATAICDDFDEDDDEGKSHSRCWRDRDNQTKGTESTLGQGLSSFKRVPTMQKLAGRAAQSSCSNSSTDRSYISNINRSDSTSSSTGIPRESHGGFSCNGDNLSSVSYGSDYDSKIDKTDSSLRYNNSGSRSGVTSVSLANSTSKSSRDADGDRGSRSNKTPSTPNPYTSSNNYPTISNNRGAEDSFSSNRLPAPMSSNTSTPSLFSSTKSTPTSSTVAKTRCTRIVLAGSSSARGVRSSVFSKCACDNLRCLSCNFKVHLFVGSSWNSGPSVDYMFFRNNTPNEAKLSTQLLRSEEQCAYCCQCSWTHTAVERTLVQGVSGDPQWTCAGH